MQQIKSLWKATKVVLCTEFIVLNTYVKNKKDLILMISIYL